MPYTQQEIKRMLRNHYDVQRLIDEEYRTIEECKKQLDECNIFLPPINMSGLPGSKGSTGDQTANMALTDRSAYYKRSIAECNKTIDNLRRERAWVTERIAELDKLDEDIIRLAIMGPRNSRERAGWRRAPWQEIAQKVNYSKTQTIKRYNAVIGKLSTL